MSSRVLRYRGPEEITYQEYVNHKGAIQQLLDTHWEKHQAWIEEEGEKLGYRWVVVCGLDIVAGGKSPDLFTDEFMEELGRATNRIPFLYQLTPLIA